MNSIPNSLDTLAQAISSEEEAFLLLEEAKSQGLKMDFHEYEKMRYKEDYSAEQFRFNSKWYISVVLSNLPEITPAIAEWSLQEDEAFESLLLRDNLPLGLRTAIHDNLAERIKGKGDLPHPQPDMGVELRAIAREIENGRITSGYSLYTLISALFQKALNETASMEDPQSNEAIAARYNRLQLASALLADKALPTDVLLSICHHAEDTSGPDDLSAVLEDVALHPNANLEVWRKIASRTRAGDELLLQVLVQIPGARVDREIRARLLTCRDMEEVAAHLCLNAGPETADYLHDYAKRFEFGLVYVLNNPHLEVEHLTREDLLPYLSSSNSGVRLAALAVSSMIEGRGRKETPEATHKRQESWRQNYSRPLPF